ncbi:hypothetical protein SNE35_13195 [Paucibacter sp. R3-3]|uniref:Uncharacterized protein n=1 Tax=Roseateles agri TaxID=3098619 RepID=A0ABU5DJN8_9BURK|nr:hypothetical protein [Paucibacter sp. R3-3]MDY0745469.1 hypothetical protein [Paucibacter sp. R3-3]
MISALVSFVVRIVLGVIGLFFVLGLLAVALMTVLGLTLWSLLRGRRPTVNMASRFAQAYGGGARFNAGRRANIRPRDAGEVVDVEVREVPDTRARLDH